jgi:hypothetical protein
MANMDLDITTWLTAIMLPVLGGLFVMIQNTKKDLQTRIEQLAQRKLDALTAVREDLAAHKLDVARGYAPLHAIRDLDRRMSMQLVRIEDKIERLGSRPSLLIAEADDEA